ncbi:MAG TPA: hypothetical protein RMH85_24640 [Polyangiaceae bacterium LLY-WYZ-15_(1-7)]|nr:hypothetical protein [Myxococcales bacterium]MAT24822.1 hypothetical protein [Sandaracinus sp.]HJK93542.1 hypothetical protein [Polyangiaceae bacterium LLY-WYZ-15_(1-7)]MBJ74176.1 hypothetical protein [Sandaracinus sp.]HJL02397.1 hypothetical protein [Polyangiaceae bacterium LLY-WYZ-15_(1-7)]
MTLRQARDVLGRRRSPTSTCTATARSTASSPTTSVLRAVVDVDTDEVVQEYEYSRFGVVERAMRLARLLQGTRSP